MQKPHVDMQKLFYIICSIFLFIGCESQEDDLIEISKPCFEGWACAVLDDLNWSPSFEHVSYYTVIKKDSFDHEYEAVDWINENICNVSGSLKEHEVINCDASKISIESRPSPYLGGCRRGLAIWKDLHIRRERTLFLRRCKCIILFKH
jgi:hypothetical protein